MTIDEKCINQEWNKNPKYQYDTYICKSKDYCPYAFEQHNEKGQPTGVNYCIERYFIKESDEK